MPNWTGSDRRERLPKNWPSLRKQVKRRAGGRCEWVVGGVRCPTRGNQCDHIRRGDNHSLSNLQWLCELHHKEKSSREGGSAKRRNKSKTRKEWEAHPAFILPPRG